MDMIVIERSSVPTALGIGEHGKVKVEPLPQAEQQPKADLDAVVQWEERRQANSLCRLHGTWALVGGHELCLDEKTPGKETRQAAIAGSLTWAYLSGENEK